MQWIEHELPEQVRFFAERGGTDFDYLEHHFPRFADTRRRFLAGRHRCGVLLDIGAHWLHQSVLYARDGFDVIAVDLPTTFDVPTLQSQARDSGVRLITEHDLETASALDSLATDSVDVLLFAEIIEHITFNPVRLWKQLHRVLKPGARIVVTTPNYYAASALAWRLKRVLSGRGGGLDAAGILRMHSHGHHWKEYSRAELVDYFALLSPDFSVVKAQYVEGFRPVPGRRAVLDWLERNVSVFKPGLYIELELTSKSAGVVIEPSW
jgi:2-polyprenyl-3-methyl-5-hydroxy-6-metoxy-1,4-benzoquinol methylase